jgi:hypothetical protein
MATVFVSRIPSAASEIVDALLSAFAFDVVRVLYSWFFINIAAPRG